MKNVFSIDDLQNLAKKRVPKMFYEYADSGSWSGETYKANQNDFSKAPLIDHLIELRSRLIRSIVIFFIGFIISFYFSTSIYSFLVNPFFDIAGSSGEMIYTAPQEFLVTKLKIGIFGASLIGLPYFAIELYLFLAPGLYENEKMALIPYFIATPFLFLISTLMVHYLIMPLALNFFISMQINSNFDNISIKLLPRVSEYLKLVTSLIIAFGICFCLYSSKPFLFF